MEIGIRLKEQRENMNLNQSELAKETGIKQQNISRWEKNTHLPNLIDLITLANYYKVSIDYLLGREDYGTGLIEIKQEPTEWERKIRDGRSQEEVREITFICEAYIQSEETYKSKIVGYITRCLEEQGKLRY